MVWNIQMRKMECCQVHWYLLPHAQPLMVTLLTLVYAKIELWADVLLLRIVLPPPFVSTTLLSFYLWRGQYVCSGEFWCQQFLPTQAIPESFLPFIYRLYLISPLGLLAWSTWPEISTAIPSKKMSVTVHPFLVAKYVQHPLRMHLTSPETQGIPCPINLMLLFCVQIPSATFSSIKMPALHTGKTSTKLLAVSPAGFS